MITTGSTGQTETEMYRGMASERATCTRVQWMGIDDGFSEWHMYRVGAVSHEEKT